MNREQQVGGTPGKAPSGSEKKREKRNGKDIGPIGTTARIVVGLGLVGSVIRGQLSVHLAPASLRTRAHRLPRARAGLALVAHSPLPSAFPRHQPAERRAAPCPLPHLVVCARLLSHQRCGAHLRRWLHGARSAPRLRRMRDAGSLQLAAPPPRPDCLRRLHAHRLPGAARWEPLNKEWPAGGNISDLIRHKRRGRSPSSNEATSHSLRTLRSMMLEICRQSSWTKNLARSTEQS
jgi:hypothetical protein